MLVLKKQYYLYLKNTKDFDLKSIKKRFKFTIIYNPKKNQEKFEDLLRFRNYCKSRSIKFLVGNDNKLCTKLKADGLYISSYKNEIIYSYHSKIGSAHNFKELNRKYIQGCNRIVMSRLFETNYKNKKGHYGLIKFNANYSDGIIALGGIRMNNINKLKLLKAQFIGILSEIKKKPANIISRLF